jgi:hypothetical protein
MSADSPRSGGPVIHLGRRPGEAQRHAGGTTTAEAELRAQNEQLIAAHETILAEQQRSATVQLRLWIPGDRPGRAIPEPTWPPPTWTVAPVRQVGAPGVVRPGRSARTRPAVVAAAARRSPGTNSGWIWRTVDGSMTVHASATWLPDGRTTGFRWILHDLRTLKAQDRSSGSGLAPSGGRWRPSPTSPGLPFGGLRRAFAWCDWRWPTGRPPSTRPTGRQGHRGHGPHRRDGASRRYPSAPAVPASTCGPSGEAWEQVMAAGRPGTLAEPAAHWDPNVIGDPFAWASCSATCSTTPWRPGLRP